MLFENQRVVYVTLLFVLILAAFFRFWKLDELPPGLYHDEAYNGLDALSLLQGKTFPLFYEGWEIYAADAHAGRVPQQTRLPIFFEGNYGREPLHIYLMALSISVLGATPFAVRAVPAAAGVLAVLTTFLATRALSDGRSNLLPLLAAFTIAILYPAVHFSRFGIRAMLFVPVETMVVACFWWGINRGKRNSQTRQVDTTWFWFLAAGALLGLGLYTFAAARLFPLLWALFVPLWFLIDRAALRRYWRYMVGMAGVAVLTALPLLLFFARYPYFFVFRIAYVANKGKGAVEGRPWLTWILNMGRVARGLVYLGETHLRHNLPGRPYFDAVQAGFFLFGVLRTFRRLLQPRFLFLLLWFGTMLLPSILSGDAPHFGRLSGAAAPAAILVALGAEWSIRKLGDLLQRLYSAEMSRAIAVGLVATLFVVSTLWMSIDYFGRFARHPDLAVDFYEADWEMGLFAASQGEKMDIYLSPTQEELATILFALEDPDRLRNYDGTGSLIPAGRLGTELLYLVRQSDIANLEQLRSIFPDGVQGKAGEGFAPFYIPADSPRNPTENHTRFPFDRQISLVGWSKEFEDDQLLVTLVWQAATELDRDYTAFIHVIGEDGRLVAQLDRPPAGYPTSDWRSGEIVIDQFPLTLPDDLSQDEEFIVNTGFYYLPTLERLGEAAVLVD